MVEPIRIDRTKMSAADRLAADTPVVALSPELLKPEKLVARLNVWVGARHAMEMTCEGANSWPQIGVRFDLHDGSTIAMRLMTEPDRLTPIEVYQNTGGWPLLKVLVMDNGLARPHMADACWRDLAQYVAGVDGFSESSPAGGAKAVIGQSVSERDGRRAYYWRV